MSQRFDEPKRLGDWLKWVDDDVKRHCVEEVTVASGEDLATGEVIGKILKSCPTTGTKNDANTGGGTCTSVTLGALAEIGIYTLTCKDVSTVAAGTATAHAFAHNTGTGAMGTITVGTGAKVGDYTLQITALVGNAGHFVVRYPDGSFCAEGDVAAAFDAGGLAFTLADGTDYVVGDGFYITVAPNASGAGATWELVTPSGFAMASKPVTGTGYTSTHLNFTINDSGTNFVVGDSFTIAVSEGSGKVKALTLSAVDGTQIAAGIMQYPVDTTGSRRYVAFTSGGTTEIVAGDIVTGATSEATANVVSVDLDSGTWAGGDAAGTLYLDNQSGTFQSENLNVGTATNLATIGGNSSAYYPDLPGTVVVRDAIIDADNLTWPTGITVTQIATALKQLEALGIVARDAA